MIDDGHLEHCYRPRNFLTGWLSSFVCWTCLIGGVSQRNQRRCQQISALPNWRNMTEDVQLGKWLQAWWKSWWLTSLSTLPSEILSLKQKLAASTFQGCHPFDQPMVNWWYTGDLGWVLNSKRDYSHTAYCTITIGTRNPNHQPEPSNHPASPGTYMPYCGKSEEEWFAPQPYQWGMARNAWWCL